MIKLEGVIVTRCLEYLNVKCLNTSTNHLLNRVAY